MAGLGAAVLFGVFVGLGIWQIERRAWKVDLIEAVEQRSAAGPVSAPGPAEWDRLTRNGDEYRRVAVKGRFLQDSSVLAQAVTDHGGGYWLMTPLRDARGFTVLVNRGFVPSRAIAARIDPPTGEIALAGLLRLSQTGGGFLRSNDPEADRWYSRDVAAIAAARSLPDPVAPYFVDVDNPARGVSERRPVGAGGYPIAGLTKTDFRNSHLAYALTWFALAGLTIVGAAIVLRRARSRGDDA
ncbi:SURF1 family protein [Fulvimarina sp. 2208YS6-2-32]|uniref:SURF1-like protein n=1 Tax=Fulvimarina uroteuthidis TaxID=3098149 RepID=A0ABU5I4A4_9HYPH|nr:SURF1 family protein [Fulvimarina sp. 2208YS6-2-32]MDY8110221.1 SURF1 family protein [Fulvimarina sp. 2208YS6-2-32]